MRPHMLLLLLGGGGLVLDAPTQTAPADATISDTPRPTFTWNAVTNALTYEIQIASDAGFSTIVDSSSAVATTSYQPASSIDLEAGASATLRWRVRTKTPVESEWSAVRTLTFSAISYLQTLTQGGFARRLNSNSSLPNQMPDADFNITTINGSPSLINSPFGTNQGLVLDANGKWVRIGNNADLAALGNAVSYTIIARFRLAASPGNTTRFIYSYDSTNHNVQISAGDKLTARLNSTTTPTGDALAVSTASIAEGSNTKIAAVYNPADKALGWRLYNGATTVSEMALTTDNALTVTRGAISTQALYFGDRAAGGGDRNILAEMFDFVAYVPIDMTLTQLNVVMVRIPD